MHITNATAIALCNAAVDRIDVGSAAAGGRIRIYNGTKPADADTAISGQTLLAELLMANPAFGNAADISPGARATANSITQDSSADATGTATWARVIDRDGTTVMDVSARATADPDNGEELVMVSTSITAGQPVQISAFTVTMPES